MKIKSIYLIGSLRNPKIPVIASALRKHGFDVFDDWYSAGPEADDYWQQYANQRGWNYREALRGHSAQHIYKLDLFHLNRCDAAVMLLPAGKSGHLELGYIRGTGKPGFILIEGIKVKRYDVMYNFATDVFFERKALIAALRNESFRQ